jgi:hypothetical protein
LFGLHEIVVAVKVAYVPRGSLEGFHVLWSHGPRVEHLVSRPEHHLQVGQTEPLDRPFADQVVGVASKASQNP